MFLSISEAQQASRENNAKINYFPKDTELKPFLKDKDTEKKTLTDLTINDFIPEKIVEFEVFFKFKIKNTAYVPDDIPDILETDRQLLLKVGMLYIEESADLKWEKFLEGRTFQQLFDVTPDFSKIMLNQLNLIVDETYNEYRKTLFTKPEEEKNEKIEKKKSQKKPFNVSVTFTQEDTDKAEAAYQKFLLELPETKPKKPKPKKQSFTPKKDKDKKEEAKGKSSQTKEKGPSPSSLSIKKHESPILEKTEEKKEEVKAKSIGKTPNIEMPSALVISNAAQISLLKKAEVKKDEVKAKLSKVKSSIAPLPQIAPSKVVLPAPLEKVENKKEEVKVKSSEKAQNVLPLAALAIPKAVKRSQLEISIDLLNSPNLVLTYTSGARVKRWRIADAEKARNFTDNGVKTYENCPKEELVEIRNNHLVSGVERLLSVVYVKIHFSKYFQYLTKGKINSGRRFKVIQEVSSREKGVIHTGINAKTNYIYHGMFDKSKSKHPPSDNIANGIDDQENKASDADEKLDQNVVTTFYLGENKTIRMVNNLTAKDRVIYIFEQFKSSQKKNG